MTSAPIPRLFLHFFDIHFLTEVAGNLPPARVEEEANVALRLAVLAADTVLLPSSSYFESDLCRRLLAPLASVFDRGSCD